MCKIRYNFSVANENREEQTQFYAKFNDIVPISAYSQEKYVSIRIYNAI